MTWLITLIRWDIIFLHRNNLFSTAGAVALMYTGIFHLVKELGNVPFVSVLLIFNDPVVTGYLFAGVLWLFDKNQNTMQAVSVLPIPLSLYLLSKVIVLSFLAVIVSFVIGVATRGLHFNPFHVFFSVLLSTTIFSLIGFSIASISRSFNQFLMYSLPFFLFTAVPFLLLFDIGNILYYVPIPSTGGIEILHGAFVEKNTGLLVYSYIHLCAWTIICWMLTVRVTIQRHRLS